jgi:N-terminal acetyltransferase B complex non-catalytic subunit
VNKIKNNNNNNNVNNNKNNNKDNDNKNNNYNNNSNNNNKNKQYNNKDLIKKMTNDFLTIQNELLSKLELKDIENEKNLTTINELLQINKNEEISKNIIIENGDTSLNSVSLEKYKVLLNLYSNEQELTKQLKIDYLNLVKNLGNYLENGNKINLDLNKINQIYYNNKRTSENNNNFEDDMDSIELGRINENDLLTDKNSTLSKRDDSKDSKNSNSLNIFLNNNYNNLASKNKFINIKQINNLKLDNKKYKNEVEKLKKKLNDANDILITVSNALIKLLNEVNLNTKIKDLFTLIFRLLNYTEDKINKLFSEKEKINNNK